MDSDSIKGLLGFCERRLGEQEQLRDRIRFLERDRICLSHGGHELEEKGDMGCKYKQCKHCLQVVED